MASLWLVVFNIAFAVLGGGIIAVGALIRFNTELFEGYVLDVLTESQVEGMNLREIFQSVAIVIMVAGFIVLVIAMIGLLGGCCKIKMMLTVYALIMMKLLVIIIVLMVLTLAMREQIDSKIKGALQPTLDMYKGWASVEPVTIGWNYVFHKFSCCGIDSVTDLSTASSWPVVNVLTPNGNTALGIAAPFFCCKNINGSFPFSLGFPSTDTCAETPTDAISNYQVGCYGAVEEYILGYRIAILVVVGLVVGCIVLNIVTACGERKGLSNDEDRAKKKKKKRKKENQVQDYDDDGYDDGYQKEAWA